MKKFLSAAIVALVVALSAHCSAEYTSSSITVLKSMVGNWYDAKGNLVLTISSDYSINGCKVVAIYMNSNYQPIFTPQSIAVYTCRIAEGSSYKDIHLDHHSMPPAYLSTPDYHEMIFLNGKTALRRTKEPRYFESVGGIYIGMSKEEVLKLYGQPSSVIYRDNGSITWKYDKQKFDVWISAGIVDSITIYKGGDRRFDWSGLSANNTEYDFKSKYSGSKGQVSRIWIIGYGESIVFGRDSVTLSINW